MASKEKEKPLEPIAIVGSSCRFPGGVSSSSQLWDLLCKPRDLTREVPADRFSARGYYHKNGRYHGTTNSIKAYWLDEHPGFFDAAFFSINPKEAEALDPQQRLTLEVVFEALEVAGFPANRYSGKDIGVYAGCMTQDYQSLSARDGLTTSPHFVVGNSRTILANRISHFFDWKGPSVSIDTACSSSLVALQIAIQDLRSGNCTVACVTGANLMFTPDQFVVESTLGMISPSGKCHMWDDRADGYARGEGIAAVLVKPLSRALADGDNIEAVIRDVGVNADGRTSQITEPNPAAQAALIRNTYRRIGLDPTNPTDQCQYFEAHGTGTPVGDPREAKAIHDAFFGDSKPSQGNTELPSPADKKMLVGSIKTVIGHTEATSGLAGLLKTVWGLKQGFVPPNLHFEKLNPDVEPYYARLQVPTAVMPWPDPAPGQPRRASVNSFGFGGSNTHAIVEAYTPAVHGAVSIAQSGSESESFSGVLATQPHPSAGSDAVTHTGPVSESFHLPVVLSAASPKSLRDVAQSLRTYLSQHKPDIRVFSWNQYSHRSDFRYRLTFPAATTSQAVETLDSLLSEHGSTIPKEKVVRSKGNKAPPRILGIFTGQGAQWPTMSMALFQQNHVYRSTIRKLDSVLKSCSHPCTWTLEGEIMAATEVSRFGEAAVAQPLCTALQIALIDFLKSIGIKFHTVVGHSSGEMAAAYAARRISAKDAIIISYYRGLVAQLAGGSEGQAGGMIAALMSEADAIRFCRDPQFGDRIEVAATNSPTSVTLSGDLDAIQLAQKELSSKGKRSKLLQVDTAYHSRHMTKPAVEYIKMMREYGVTPISRGNGTVWISSVKGHAPRSATRDLDCQYWADNMTSQVQFYEAVERALTLAGDTFDCVIEVGPHPALQGPFAQTARSLRRTIPYTSPLNRAQGSELSIAEFLGFMWSTFGPSSIDLHKYIEQSPVPNLLCSRLSDLPAYPFDHSVKYWRESRISYQFNFQNEAPHELLGVRSAEDTAYELTWRNVLRPEMIPWLSHHRFQNQALLPASAYCVMAFDAARAFLVDRPASMIELRDMDIHSGISIDSEGPGVETRFSLNIVPGERDSSTIDATFALYSSPVGHIGTAKMNMNAAGSLHIVLGQPSTGVLPHRQPALSETLAADPQGFYDMIKETGLIYTGPFKALTSIQRRYGYCSVTLDRVHRDETTTLDISPAMLDSCFQSAFLSYASPGDGSLWTTFLPSRIRKVQFSLAAFTGETVCDPKSKVTVDTHLIQGTPPTTGSNPRMAVDIAISNAAGEIEIQIEDLVVRALGVAPKEDKEMYLHTVTDVDPTDEIVLPGVFVPNGDDTVLVDNYRQIASFYLQQQRAEHGSHAIENGSSQETEASIEATIRQSNYPDYLSAVQVLGKLNATQLNKKLPSFEEEARQVAKFQNHVGRIIKQIIHRYPWMDILYLPAGSTEPMRPVMAAMGNTFQSLTIGQSPKDSLSAGQSVQINPIDGVRQQNMNLNEKLGSQIKPTALLDLVILHGDAFNGSDRTTIVKNIGEVMKLGGFLVLVERRPTILGTLPEQPSGTVTGPLIPPLWHDMLESYGFIREAKNSAQFSAVGAVSVHQFGGSTTESRLAPQTGGINGTVINKLLFIQSAFGKTSNELIGNLRLHFASHFNDMSSCFFDDMTTQDLENCTAVIMLADLDEPLITNMTEHRIDQFRALFRPGLTILWVTCDARSGNPDHAASIGFLRTMAAEEPALKMQMLDLDCRVSAHAIASAFQKLLLSDKEVKSNIMGTFEPEIYMENGRRLIPRTLPWKQGNDRLNALRRVVTRPINTLRQRVELIPGFVPGGVSGSLHYRLKDTEQPICEPPRGYVTIRVDYSSAVPIKLGENLSSYVCVGRKLQTEERMVALSGTNSSYITCSSKQAIPLPKDAPSNLAVLNRVVRCNAALTVSSSLEPDIGRIVLVNPDVGFAEYLAYFTALRSFKHKIVVFETYNDQSGKPPLFTLPFTPFPPSLFTFKQKDVIKPTSRTDQSQFPTGTSSDSRIVLLRIHAQTPTRQIKRMFAESGIVFNFLPEDHALSQKIKTSVPYSCAIHYSDSFFDLDTRLQKKDYPAIKYAWERAVTVSQVLKDPSANFEKLEATPAASLSDIQSSSGTTTQPFRLFDWKTDRNVHETIQHMIDEQLFFPDKTYYLFGITRDFGQSLCHFFLQRGARNIVLASRNPTASPHWIAELSTAYDADIRLERADVINVNSIITLKHEMGKTMPAVGGIVNGAMVLDDRTFAQMTLETWNRVLRPKTVGSSNLDRVFSERDLDFFIMTSSFAAMGGHPGQSNYGAANNYMNGLAADRRRRGLAGSALNIGVIYGLGFLHREKSDLYAGLEREGYPPISEHDLHHMFLEAIVAGRPAEQISDTDTNDIGFALQQQHRHPADITTGLRRYRRGAADPLHWHLDPRFSHFALRDRAEDDETTATEAQQGHNLREELEKMDEAADMAATISSALTRRVQTLLGLPDGSVDGQSSMADLGLDSIASTEVRNWFMRNVGREIPVMKIRDAPSVEKLSVTVAEEILKARGVKKDEDA
ncbi:hypothetical protein F4777DRAFT_393782 [Nemania sp. FL0916]|nr:hypothetical protein F4777DRAFT_393782 [Nemania sp. FL0916]